MPMGYENSGEFYMVESDISIVRPSSRDIMHLVVSICVFVCHFVSYQSGALVRVSVIRDLLRIVQSIDF